MTFGGKLQGWVSIVTTWGSRFGGRSRKPEQRLGDMMTDGDAVGGLGDGDGGD